VIRVAKRKSETKKRKAERFATAEAAFDALRAWALEFEFVHPRVPGPETADWIKPDPAFTARANASIRRNLVNVGPVQRLQIARYLKANGGHRRGRPTEPLSLFLHEMTRAYPGSPQPKNADRLVAVATLAGFFGPEDFVNAVRASEDGLSIGETLDVARKRLRLTWRRITKGTPPRKKPHA